MNIENRILKQVEVDDAINADKVFDILMGNDAESESHLSKIMPKWRI